MAEKAGKEKKVLYAQKSILIDPIDCGSSVSYRLAWDAGYWVAEIQLADCTHKVTWYFGRNESSVNKVDEAIKTLQAFKRDLVKALEAAPKKEK